MADEAFMVLNMGESQLWGAMHDGERIPPDRQPTVVHRSRTTAEAEALRLQKAHPDGRFVVFEATRVTTTLTAPTHMTLGGQALGEQRVAVLCWVDNGAPF